LSVTERAIHAGEVTGDAAVSERLATCTHDAALIAPFAPSMTGTHGWSRSASYVLWSWSAT